MSGSQDTDIIVWDVGKHVDRLGIQSLVYEMLEKEWFESRRNRLPELVRLSHPRTQWPSLVSFASAGTRGRSQSCCCCKAKHFS